MTAKAMRTSFVGVLVIYFVLSSAFIGCQG
jgi:hypothetical protein